AGITRSRAWRRLGRGTRGWASRRRARGWARGCARLTTFGPGLDFLGYKLAGAVPAAFDLDAGARADIAEVVMMMVSVDLYLGVFANENNGLDTALVAHRQLAIRHANDGSADFGLFAVGIAGRRRIRIAVSQVLRKPRANRTYGQHSKGQNPQGNRFWSLAKHISILPLRCVDLLRQFAVHIESIIGERANVFDSSTTTAPG